MKNARLRHILTVVDTILSLPPDEREPYLTEVCGEDAVLREEVGQLLESIRESETFWDGWEDWNQRQVHNLFQSIDAHEQDVVQEHIGPWRLVRLLGRGGMGTVWLAERADGSYEQRAAIKLLHYGREIGESASERTSSIRRFEQERQILARMDHPNIARLYDGGLTDDGRPWLAMEFIDGQPVTDWCWQHESSLKQRLHLFEEICEAVRYAHKNLIVHRDLKPENILVTEEGHVKILDFGIAKLLDEELTASQRLRTRTGIRAMSLEYAAPEQISGEPVTTATDAYSLGLLLYELLTGSYPFNLEGKNLRQIEQILREEEPGRPSTRNDTRLRDLHGDLDAITLKALRKEPDQRYESAGHLLDDIGRYRNHQAVLARRDSLWYRIGKFVRRHKRSLVASAMVLFGFIGMATYYTLQLANERNQARLEAARAEQVSTFLEDLFNASDPFLAAETERPDTLRVRHFLDRGAEKIQHELSNQPEVQSRMLHVVSNVYQNLGLYDKAVPLLEEAIQIERRVSGPEHTAVAEHLLSLAHLFHQKGEYDAAEEYYRNALNIYRKSGEGEEVAVARARTGLALVLRDKGRFDEAERLIQEALTIQRAQLGPDHADVAESLDRLGTVYHLRANLEAAEAIYREALALHRQLWGDGHPKYAQALLNMATLLREKGAYDEAEPLIREALTIRVSVLGEEHPLSVTALYELAILLREAGDLDEAVSLFRHIVELDGKLLGPDHHYVGLDTYELGITLNKMQDFGEAERTYRQSLEILRNALPAIHPNIAHALNGLGYNYISKGEPASGEPLLREALDIYRESLGDSAWWTGVAMSTLGHALMDQQRFAESEPLLLDGYAILDQNGGPVRAALERLVRFYEQQEEADNAETYRKLLEEASH